MNKRFRFERDYALWQSDTALMSSLSDMVIHEAYQRIIDLGPAGVPFIIERLRESPDHLIWALTAIVGKDVAAGTDTIPLAARRWVEWYDHLPADSEFIT